MVKIMEALDEISGFGVSLRLARSRMTGGALGSDDPETSNNPNQGNHHEPYVCNSRIRQRTRADRYGADRLCQHPDGR